MSLYIIPTEAEVALAAAATTKYALGVKAGTEFGLILCGFAFSFDGEAAASPVEVAILHCTFATNAPGTNSAAVTEVRANGLRAATGITGAREWTAAPTVIGGAVWGPHRVDSEKATFDKDIPLLDQPDTDLGAGFLLSLLLETGDAATATFRGELRVRRC